MKDLAIAYNLSRHNKKKMAKGGMVENEDLHPTHEPEEVVDPMPEEKEAMPAHMFYGPKKIAGDIVKRRMAKGGMCYAEGGVVNDDRTMAEMHEPDYASDTYPDPDNMEHTEGMEEMPKRKMILANIMRGVRSRHMGK